MIQYRHAKTDIAHWHYGAAARLLQVTVVAMLFVSVLTVSCDVMRHGASG